MAEEQNPSPPRAVKPNPFVTITMIEGRVSLQTNLAPEMRPMINWMLDQAKMTVLTTLSDQEQSKLVKPGGNGLQQGMLARMGQRHG